MFFAYFSQIHTLDLKKSRYHSFSGSGKDQKMTVNLAGVGKPTDRVEEAEKNILDIQKIQIPFFVGLKIKKPWPELQSNILNSLICN